MLSNIAEVRSRGATVVLVADDGDEESAAAADHVLWVPADHPAAVARGRRRAAAAAGLPPGPPARARPRPPPQPGQDGDRRVMHAGVQRHRRRRRRRRRRGRASGGCSTAARASPARCFTETERSDASGSADAAQSLAARFAAKEAVMKALGTGLGGFAADRRRGVPDARARAPRATRRPSSARSGRRAGRRAGRGHLPPVAHPHRRRGHRLRRRGAGPAVRAVLTRDEMRAADAAALAHRLARDAGGPGRHGGGACRAAPAGRRLRPAGRRGGGQGQQRRRRPGGRRRPGPRGAPGAACSRPAARRGAVCRRATS